MGKQNIIFVGGGSAGHVLPNIVLIKALTNEAVKIYYIGSYTGIEKSIVQPLPIQYLAIHTGKLRRYFSMQNFFDPIKIIIGFFQSIKLLWSIKPKLVFAKGGFVSVPVVFAARLLNIPCILHESDITTGLANKICAPMANKVLLTFKPTVALSDKYCYVGPIIREDLWHGQAQRVRQQVNFISNNPTVMFIAGGSGSQQINDFVVNNYQALLTEYNIIHLTGHANATKIVADGYFQLEYAAAELVDLFVMSDLVISRAGSNTIHEILALQKPHILLPLSTNASRGEQELNAKYFQRHYTSKIVWSWDIKECLLDNILDIKSELSTYKKALQQVTIANGNQRILQIINQHLGET